MKKIAYHIERVRGKPHHVRKHLTLVAAGVGTGLIALVWLAGSLSAGAFAIHPTSFADTGKLPIAEGRDRRDEGIAGAAAVLPFGTESPRIEIVNTASSTDKKVQPTTISF